MFYQLQFGDAITHTDGAWLFICRQHSVNRPGSQVVWRTEQCHKRTYWWLFINAECRLVALDWREMEREFWGE